MVKTLPKTKPQPNKQSGFYGTKSDRFTVEYLDRLQSAILNSPYLAASQLSENFAGTRGFSVVFKRSGIEEVIKHFPEFQPYLEIALKSGCNAFYLNPLVIEAGGDVKPHVDCSISSYEMAIAVPQLVSVLYVKVPDDIQGGELVLSRDGVSKVISPVYNTLLYFLGNLTHSVNSFYSEQPRISLICEQYNLSEERLAHIPDFEIISDNLPRKVNKTGNNQLYYAIENFLPPETSDRLLQWAIDGESDFEESELEVDRDDVVKYRNSLVYRSELDAEFAELFENRIRQALPDVMAFFDLNFSLADIEQQLTAHNDGHYFRLHSDNSVGLAVGRELTFVYYFRRSPSFTGGELRIFDSDDAEQLSSFELVVPEHNKMVFFPSHYLHEVLPINCPTKAFADSRFTVNGWLWKTMEDKN